MIPDVLALVFWVRLPLAVARLSPAAASVLTDGVYLVRGTGLAALGPIVAALAGTVAGARHLGQAFTASLLTMAVLGVLGILSAHLGLWTVAGYVFGDLVIHDRAVAGLGALGALVVAAILLGLLTVYIPLLVGAARLAARRIDERGRPPVILEALVAALTTAVAATAWALAARVLVRPVYAWQGLEPGPTELAPLLARWEVLVGVLALAAAFRVWREDAARGEIVRAHVATLRRDLAGASRPAGRPWPEPARLVAGAAALTVVVAGLVGGAVQAMLTLAFFAGLLWARGRLATAWWPLQLLRVPALVRGAAALSVGFGLSGLILYVSNGLGAALLSTCLITTLVTLAAAK